MKQRMRKIVVYTLLVTIPINIIFMLWAINVKSEYAVLSKIKNTLPKGKRLYKLGNHEAKIIYNLILDSAGYSIKTDIGLLLDNQKKNKFYSSDLSKTNNYEKAVAIFDNKSIHKVKLRLRGDNYWHWLYDEKSWKIKTKKSDLINKSRKINLVVPKADESLSNNILAYSLASKLNMLSPDANLISMSLNGNFNGLRMKLEQIDESFLRRNARMPNDIYKGDLEGKSYVMGANIKLFSSANIWDKLSYNNHYDKNNTNPLHSLLLDIDNDIYDLYNVDEFASFMAFIDMTSSFHYDKSHNWVLLYDNYLERFSPIIWDPNAWRDGWLYNKKLNIASSKLFLSLYRNYDFIRMKYKILNDFYENKHKSFLDEIKNTIADEKKLEEDTYFLNTRTSKKLIDKLDNVIEDRLNLVRQYNLGLPNMNKYKYMLDGEKIKLSISGSKYINKMILIGENLSMIKNINISYFQNDKKYTKTLEFKYIDNQIIMDMNLLANVVIKDIDNMSWQHATYEEVVVEFDFISAKKIKIDILKLGFLGSKNKMYKIRKSKLLKNKSYSKHLINMIKTKNVQIEQTWSNQKRFSGFTLIKNDLIIAPGTKIIFDENATLKVLGKVTAMGTKENPIVFEAKDKTKPWNTFALKDAKANGSTFKYCIFKDGSGDKGDLHEYTAMFSVHNVKDLLVEDCEFYDSKRTDDMVHVIYSDATFKNTKFVRSLSDALDVDISNLMVDNCEFIDSGNDSIDLMTTNAVVINTKFTNSKDKGISIGEGSNLLAINNHIQGSEIGMQSKDTSKAYIYNTTFLKNKKAIDAYHKNWRYSKGGTIYLDKCVFEKNILNATVGKKSKVVINSSSIDTPNKFNTKSLRKKKIIISDDNSIEYDLKEPLFENKNYLINNQQIGHYE